MIQVLLMWNVISTFQCTARILILFQNISLKVYPYLTELVIFPPLTEVSVISCIDLLPQLQQWIK